MPPKAEAFGILALQMSIFIDTCIRTGQVLFKLTSF